MNNLLTFDNLVQLGREVNFPFTLKLGEELLYCQKLLRLLPGRRLVCLATCNNVQVVAKLFIHVNKSELDYEQEINGYRLLVSSNIKTPEMFASGTIKPYGYYVLYHYLSNTESLQEVLLAHRNYSDSSAMRQLLSTIACMHQSGIQQIDLHLNNFLIQNKRLFTIDCGDVSPLSHNSLKQMVQKHKNLADILSQLPVAADQWLRNYVSHYNREVDSTSQLSVSSLCAEMKYWRDWRSRKYLNKAARNCSEFIAEQRWGERRVYKRACSSASWLDFYNHLDALVESSKRLKDGNTATVALAECEGRKIVIKRYNIKNFRHWLGRFWRPSRAWRTWQNVHRLKVLGIQSPEPIAVIEKRFGWLRRQAFYVSEYEPAADAFSFYSDEEIVSAQHLEDFKTFFTSLFFASISHGDLKAYNLLLTRRGISVIDLDAMNFHKNQTAFNKAYARDCRRFMRNWLNSAVKSQQFERILKELPVNPCNK